MISNSDIDNDLSLAGKEQLQHFPLEENPMNRGEKQLYLAKAIGTVCWRDTLL